MSTYGRSLVELHQTMIRALAIALLAMPCHGAQLEDLIAAGDLSVTVTVDTQAPYYLRAPLIFAVEVATPRWFSRGTRVRDFRVENAIVRPVSAFADNQSQQRDAVTWSMQRWRFRLYPQREGTLTLPHLSVFVSVNTEEHGVVEGDVSVTPMALRIETPPGLDSGDTWVATPSLRIEQQWSGLNEVYLPGDAISRTRRFTIEDAPAMVLDARELPDIPGLSLYQAPARLDDESSRGSLRGIREEQLVITAEQAGDFTIPGAAYTWLNTRTGNLETIELEAYSFRVQNVADSGSPVGAGAKSEWPSPASLRALLIPVSGLMIAIATIWLLRRSIRFPALQHVIDRGKSSLHYLGAKKDYYRAAQSQDAVRCLNLLYEQLCQGSDARSLAIAVGDDRRANNTLRQLLARAYAPGHEGGLPDRDDMQQLWLCVVQTCRRSSRLHWPGHAHRHDDSNAAATPLAINPPPSKS